MLIEIPHIAFIGQSIANGFQRVENGSAANSKEEVCTEFLRKLDTFSYLGKSGVGYYSAKFCMSDAVFVKSLKDLSDILPQEA